MNEKNRVDSAMEDSISTPPSRGTDTTLVGPEDIESSSGKPQQVSWLSRWLSTSSKTSKLTPEEEMVEYAPVTKSLDECPDGYPRVATFQASDRNFLQYRSFRTSHCRVLSGLQHEAEQLEQELDQLDAVDEKSPSLQKKLASKTRDDRQCPIDLAAGLYPCHLTRSRPTVLSLLKSKLLEYDEFLLKTRDICSLQKPSKRDFESVRMWFRDEKPLVTREAQFIRRKEDLVTLRTGRESAGFDSFVERCLGGTDRFMRTTFRCKVIQYLFLTPELRAKTKDEAVRYYAPSRVDALVNIIITVVIFILLVLPVVVLYEMTNFSAQASALDAIGVLIVFTLIFGMAISTLTTARRQELFGASAAYCAVLVVFISNFGVQQVEMVPSS